jgi:hypothetical protein
MDRQTGTHATHKSQPRTGHTREPDPKHLEQKHKATHKTATHERTPDRQTSRSHTHTHASRLENDVNQQTTPPASRPHFRVGEREHFETAIFCDKQCHNPQGLLISPGLGYMSPYLHRPESVLERRGVRSQSTGTLISQRSARHHISRRPSLLTHSASPFCQRTYLPCSYCMRSMPMRVSRIILHSAPRSIIRTE